MNAGLISVVIPALDEEARIDRVIEQLGQDASAPFETIVVDGGSKDGTVAAAKRQDAHVISAPRGRGHQLSAGAAGAAGDILWFLHADCDVPAGALGTIRQAIDTDHRTGGNFRLIFDGETAFSHWLTGFYAWFRRRGLYYGDSGIFVRRDVYDDIGGIRAMALMEDYDFTRRLERYGRTCCIDTPALKTSSRKFDGRRPPGIVLGWLKIHALYSLGVSPDRLARLYYGR